MLTHPTSGFDRGVDGKGACQIQASGSFPNEALLVDLVVSNGIQPGVVIPWMATEGAAPVRLSPSNTLEIVPVTQAPSDLSTWGGNANYAITNATPAPTGVIPNGTSIDSLSVNGPSSKTVLTIGSSTSDVLTVRSGLIGLCAASSGNLIITNGSITSGTNELNVLTGLQAGSAEISVYSAIVGPIALTKAGNKILHLYSANSYSGGTFVNGGTIIGEVAGSIPGPLFVEAGSTFAVRTGAIVTNSSITVRREGLLQIPDGTASYTFSGLLTFDGGVMTFGNAFSGSAAVTVNTPGTGLVFGDGGLISQISLNSFHSFKLYTDVSCSAASSNQAIITTINRTNLVQFMDMNTGAAATRTFTVSNAVGLAAGVSEMVLDIPLREPAGFPVTIMKKGDGILEISRMNGTISGGAVVSNGTLLLDMYVPATNRACQLTLGSAAVTGLASTNGLYVGELLTGSGLPAQAVIKSIDSASQVTLTVNASSTTNYSVRFPACGSLGTGSVTVAGSGTLDGVGVGGNVTVKTGGTLAPGTTTNIMSTFNVGGNLLVESGGILSVDLTASSNDVVAVAGTADITGAILAVNGPKPVVGQTLTILTATSVAGTFATVPDGYSVKTVGNTLQLSRAAAGFVFSVE
ncbi:MAG: autotransporter-associated beta strand repeat-containing protein [bacterium]